MCLLGDFPSGTPPDSNPGTGSLTTVCPVFVGVSTGAVYPGMVGQLVLPSETSDTRRLYPTGWVPDL